jgi:hypothetical protein
MQPRLSTSRKWTPLPDELVKQIRSVFRQNFKEQIGAATVEVEGSIFPGEILVCVGIRHPKELKQSGFGVSIAYSRNKDNVIKLLHLAVDAVASLFEQLFSAETDHDFPRVWEEVQFEGRSIFVQYTTENTELEHEADRILGVGDRGSSAVAQGDWDDSDEITPEHIKAQLGIEPNGDDDSDDDRNREGDEAGRKQNGVKAPKVSRKKNQ